MTTITKKTTLLEREPLAQSSDGTLKIMTAKADGNDWEFTGSGFQVWTPGQRGIPRIDYSIGEQSLAAADCDFTASADGKTLALNADIAAAFLESLGDMAACDGTATIIFTAGPDSSAEYLVVPIRYNPA